MDCYRLCKPSALPIHSPIPVLHVLFFPGGLAYYHNSSVIIHWLQFCVVSRTIDNMYTNPRVCLSVVVRALARDRCYSNMMPRVYQFLHAVNGRRQESNLHAFRHGNITDCSGNCRLLLQRQLWTQFVFCHDQDNGVRLQ